MLQDLKKGVEIESKRNKKFGTISARPEFDSRQGQDFSLLHSVQTGSGAHTASCTMGTGGSFPGGKAAGA
jgi:hypothetical protein